MNDTNVILEVKNLKKTFGDHVVLKDINTTITKGEVIAIIGPSGCGKSTTGRTMIKLYNPTSGNVYYDGKDIFKYNHAEQKEFCKKVQMIFQNPYSSLNPRMTVGQIIGEGLLAHGIFKKNDEKMQAYVMEVMEKCGLAPYMIHRYPHQFSGGQRQRIGIARALALKPRFVVCDEAVSALDVSIQSQIVNLLKDLGSEDNLAYLFISHGLSVVKYISDRIGVMYLGNIVELAESQE